MTSLVSKKFGRCVFFTIRFLMAFSLSMEVVNSASADEAIKGPSAYLPETLYEFSGVMDGKVESI